jgi:hypothetical protein
MYDLLAADIGGHGIPHDFWSAPNITAGFLALPGSSFVATGAAPATDLLIASAGVEVGFRNGFSVGARFDGEFAEHSQKYSGIGRLRYTWWVSNQLTRFGQKRKLIEAADKPPLMSMRIILANRQSETHHSLILLECEQYWPQPRNSEAHAGSIIAPARIGIYRWLRVPHAPAQMQGKCHATNPITHTHRAPAPFALHVPHDARAGYPQSHDLW